MVTTSEPDDGTRYMTLVATISDLNSLIGRRLGPSREVTIDQDRIDAFSACTLDEQWIHTDPVRAERSAGYGVGTRGTVAHGFLTLALVSHVLDEVLHIDGAAALINYGLDKVRFPAPVPSGAVLTGIVEVRQVDSESTGHFTMRCRVSLTESGELKPACVAETITRIIPTATHSVASGTTKVFIPAPKGPAL